MTAIELLALYQKLLKEGYREPLMNRTLSINIKIPERFRIKGSLGMVGKIEIDGRRVIIKNASDKSVHSRKIEFNNPEYIKEDLIGLFQEVLNYIEFLKKNPS